MDLAALGVSSPIRLFPVNVVAHQNDRHRLFIYGPPPNLRIRYSPTVDAMMRSQRELYSEVFDSIRWNTEFVGNVMERCAGLVRVGLHEFYWRFQYVAKNFETPGYWGRILWIQHGSERQIND